MNLGLDGIFLQGLMILFETFHLFLDFSFLHITGMLDVCFSYDFAQKMFLTPPEHLMPVHLLPSETPCLLIEVVHVQLPNKRIEIGVLEVLWHDLLAILFNV